MLEDVPARYSMIYFNDVWRSSDAVSWKKMPANDFGIRAQHAAAVDPETGRIYIQGGVHGVIFETGDTIFHPLIEWQDLWSSDDGINWMAESDTSMVDDSYLFRADHDIIYYDGKLWALPGATTSNEHYHFTQKGHIATWTYEDGNYWLIDSEGTDIDARHGYATVLFEDKIWIMGGFTSSNAQSNDVWSAY